MAWPKIKNIIILILLGLNLCLGAFSVGRVMEARQTRLQARENALQFLEERGITLDRNSIPQEMTLTPMRVSRQLQEEAGLAAALLMGEVEMEARGAEVYRYFNDLGSVQFHSGGEFSARFAPNALQAEEQDLEHFSQTILSRLDIQGELVDHFREGEGQSLTFRQLWQGVPLFNCRITLNFQGTELRSITSARRLMGQPVEDGTVRTVTAATALMRFYSGVSALGDVCGSISGITEGYMVSADMSGSLALTPVWSIQTDGRPYQLNTVTGALSRQIL